jgi:succinate dehydrogenase / fumarate reductase flavoprotein subunit
VGDYNLMSNVPGLFVVGEANFSDHGANRLGASALMQGLADGYFILPYTIGDYLAGQMGQRPQPAAAEFRQAEQDVRERTRRLLAIRGKKTVTEFHKQLGKLMWDNCGMARNATGLAAALQQIPALREEFWASVNVPGEAADLNQSLERAGRVADFLELAELMVRDALLRNESCGGHFREEYQTPEGECLRNDAEFAHVAAWEFTGAAPVLHKEPLMYEELALAQRSYR